MQCSIRSEKNYYIFCQLETRLRMQDEVAEWLRRWTANPMGSARVGSNPILVGKFLLFKLLQIIN